MNLTEQSTTEPVFARAPRSVEETGLPFLFLVELISKVLLLRGQIRLTELSSHLKLTISVLDPLIAYMRTEKLCEISRRGGSSGTDADLSYSLTEAGRIRATEFSSRNSYTGAAPVTLAAYCAQVEAQSVAQMCVTRADVNAEFQDIVVSTNVLEQLGAAMNSGRAIFVHGPSGSGKTYLAERLRGLLKGSILVPHAVLVDGEVVPFYDPVIHSTPEASPDPESTFDRRAALDTRWIRTIRPAVLTGGELTLEMLGLQFDQGSHLYQAPPHFKANNGIFIIDDLGRQRCSPVELMNRWIVPMDRRVDYLSLHTGYKFQVPFDVIVVFSSNFPPQELADGAFLRRLGYKIHVADLTEQQYQSIFAQVCEQYCIPYSSEAFQYLLQEHHHREQRPLLACYPRDILSQVRDLARFEQRAPSLDQKVLKWAWNNYFTGS